MIQPANDPGRDPVDRPAGPSAFGALGVAASAWCLLLLAGWLPHYLTRPWYTDHDHFAMLAQLWGTAGKVPYRDTFSMQFPGEIYLYLAMGGLTGWGNTVAFNAADAGMVVGLGLLMIAWGRRLFGTALPGLIGSATLLVYYLDKDYTFTGQRDWHATFYALVGLIVLLGWPGRGARVGSAILYAMSVLTRPQFALLAPAMLMAGFNQPTAEGGATRLGLRGAVEWGCASAVALVIGFVPLFAAGAFDDFLRCLRSVTYGSGYNRASPRSILFRVYFQVSGRLGGLTVPASILLLSAGTGARSRRVAWALIVAMAGLFLYAPVSPNFFPHYQVPFEATFAVGVCFLAGLLVTSRERTAVRLAAVLLLFGMVGLRKPEFVTVRGDYDDRVVEYHGKPYVLHRKEYGVVEAIAFLRSGVLPVGTPPGYRDGFVPYPWDDVRGLILYLREHTSPETPVANLTMDCAAAIVGVVPRPSALPADNFSLANFSDLWMGPDLKALEDTPACVVVWNPTSAEAEFPRFAPIWKAVRQRYRPEAKFGELEVWRKPRQ